MARINIEIGDKEADLNFPLHNDSLSYDPYEFSRQLHLALVSLKMNPKTIAKRLIAESEAAYGEATS